jgi:D-3-phosphoglycerate dehydrogenase
MEVYGCDPYLSVDAAWKLSKDIKHVLTREEIYAECDYISVHVPLIENEDPAVNTKKMLNKEAISMMKDGVVILNFARDLLVDDDAMEEALKSGKVARYVTDFPNARTANMEKTIVTPHLGASTGESEDNCAKMAVKEMMDYLENGNIKNSVNYPACDMGICTQAGRVAIFHKNVANMLTQFTAVLGEAGINISDMTNKSRGEVAYTLMDLEAAASEEVVARLQGIDGVFRVRVVK